MRTSGLTLRLGSFAAVSLIGRYPSLSRRPGSPVRRPPGRVATPRLRVSAAPMRLPVLPSVSRVLNADLARSRPFRALRAAVRTPRTAQPARTVTWERAALTGVSAGAITLAATRGLAAATPTAPLAPAALAEAPAPASDATSTETPKRPPALARTPTRPAPLQLAAHRRLDSAIHTEQEIIPAASAAGAGRPRAHAISLGTTAPPRPAVAARSRTIGETRRELAASAVRAQTVAMTGLLATRDSVQRKVAQKRTVLASAFGPGVEIKPTAAQLTEAPASPTPRIGAHRGAEPTPNVETPAAPGKPVSRLDKALGRAAALAYRGKQSAEHAGAAVRGHARATRDTAAEMRRLLPAPPRVSLTVSGPKAAKAPMIPAAAHSRLVPGPDGALRPSLIDTTAALFAAKFGAERAAMISADVPTTAMGAQPMTMSHVSPVPTDRTVATKSLLDDPRALQELTDKVVDRIEARVIDELERRGRRHNSGSF